MIIDDADIVIMIIHVIDDGGIVIMKIENASIALMAIDYSLPDYHGYRLQQTVPIILVVFCICCLLLYGLTI